MIDHRVLLVGHTSNNGRSWDVFTLHMLSILLLLSIAQRRGKAARARALSLSLFPSLSSHFWSAGSADCEVDQRLHKLLLLSAGDDRSDTFSMKSLPRDEKMKKRGKPTAKVQAPQNTFSIKSLPRDEKMKKRGKPTDRQGPRPPKHKKQESNKIRQTKKEKKRKSGRGDCQPPSFSFRVKEWYRCCELAGGEKGGCDGEQQIK